MTDEEKELTLRWIAAWRSAGPVLERIRREEIRKTDTQEAIRMLDGWFEEVNKNRPPRLTSGLVEQQAIFHRRRT